MLREKITAEYLEQIFRENYSRYYYYALSVVDESEVAKDIIGEVFLAVWKNRADIDEKKLNSYIPQFGIRIVHKKVGRLTNILYLYR